MFFVVFFPFVKFNAKRVCVYTKVKEQHALVSSLFPPWKSWGGCQTAQQMPFYARPCL